MKAPKFKIGDVVRPIKGKKSSNTQSLQNLVTAIVSGTNRQIYNNKREIAVTISKGTSKRLWISQPHKAGDRIFVYEDAFELVDSEDDTYEVY